MKKPTHFISFHLLAALLLLLSSSLYAQIDYTDRITNPSFELNNDGNPHTSGVLRVIEPYGWSYNHSFATGTGSDPELVYLGNNSQGLNNDTYNRNGNWGYWFSGNVVLPEFVELSQTIGSEDYYLPAGTYKVSCRMTVITAKITTQRLFANEVVQYYGVSGDYNLNLTPGETNNYAGYTVDGADPGTFKDMEVTITLDGNTPLKIGVRTGSKMNTGTTAVSANPLWGWFKLDYFRITKMPEVANDATLSDLKVDGVTIAGFDPFIEEYSVTLPAASTPVITATTTQSEANHQIIGNTVVVTSENSSVTKTYTINFLYSQSTAWGGNGATGSGSQPDNFGWRAYKGSTDVGSAPYTTSGAGFIRYQDNLSPYGTGRRLLFLRWDTNASYGSLDGTTVHSFPITLEAFKTYKIRFDYAGQNTGAITIGAAINTERDNNGTSLASRNFSCVYRVWNEAELIVTPTESREYYLTINRAVGTEIIFSFSNLVINEQEGVTVDGAITIDDNKEFSSLTLRPQAQVTIASGKTLTVTGNLTLESNASGTATIRNDGTLVVNGTTTVQQYLPTKTGGAANDNWWYISSPVSGATAGSILVPERGNLIGYYNEPTATYPQITNDSTVLEAGKGYLAKINTSESYTFTGTLNNGTLDPITLTRTVAAGGPRGFNLLGNPYPSYINWNEITGFGTEGERTDIRPTVWVRTRNNSGNMVFDTFDGQIGTQNGIRGALSNQIAPMQAFWVKVNQDGATPTVQFSNSMRSHQVRTTGNLLKAPSATAQQVLRLQISNGSNTDETIIATYDAAKIGYDFYDSEKMPINVASIPEIYSMVDGKDLVINKMSQIPDEVTIQLGVRMGQAGEYTIRATDMINFANWRITLQDHLLNTETELSNESDYTFSTEGASTSDRFSLALRSPGTLSGTTDAIISVAHIYLNADQRIAVSSKGIATNSPVTVYNLAGQAVINSQTSGDYTLLPNTLNAGVYIVKVNNEVQKIVVR